MLKEKPHWEEIYRSRPSATLSWTQERPAPSIDWILESMLDGNAGVLDIGGGTSYLIDYLLNAGFRQPAILDISANALAQVKARLGDRAPLVEWIEADITSFHPARKYSLWHDRAVFHFLTRAEQRAQYVTSLKRSLVKGGRVIMATFSSAGPVQCSGLNVMRFDANGLAAELGKDFKLVRDARVAHTTPSGASQEFQYCEFVLS